MIRTVTSDARELLDAAAEALALSTRAYHRVVKVARTIADLAHEQLTRPHISLKRFGIDLKLSYCRPCADHRRQRERQATPYCGNSPARVAPTIAIRGSLAAEALRTRTRSFYWTRLFAGLRDISETHS